MWPNRSTTGATGRSGFSNPHHHPHPTPAGSGRYSQTEVPAPQQKTVYPGSNGGHGVQGAGVHGTHAQPSYAHDVHSRAGVSSSDVHSSAYAYNRHSSGASASHHSQPQHSAYSQPPFTSAYETQQAQAHAQQPQPTYQPYTQSQFDRVPQTYHSSPGVQTPTPQKEATATPAREPYRAEQSYQQQSQEHKEPERPASRPVTPPVVSPRPVVITCPFEKLEKVVKDMNRVRVTLERDAFRALTHTDSLQDADVLKKRKNYDESLTHCMLQLDAIEATGEDRERIKSERRVIISSIQKLQACLEEYVEREKTLHALEQVQMM